MYFTDVGVRNCCKHHGASPRHPLLQDAWKGPVKVALIVLSLGCVILNASASTIDLEEAAGGGSSSHALVEFVSAGSYILFVACVVTGAVLIASFSRALLASAREEQKAIESKDLRRAAHPRTAVRALLNPAAASVPEGEPPTSVAASTAAQAAAFNALEVPSDRGSWAAMPKLPRAARGTRLPPRGPAQDRPAVRQLYSGVPVTKAVAGLSPQ